MSQQQQRDRLRQFELVVGAADAKTILDLAEVAGNVEAATSAIATMVGLPFKNFDNLSQASLKAVITDRLISLRPMARAAYYNYVV